MELFNKAHKAGVFRGFREGGLEFHADLALPYRPDFHKIPMHGQFLLVQLETPDEAVLGRIAAFSSEGKLSFGSGEEFNIRAVQEGRDIPDDLREQYLKYRVNIRVLGVLRNGEGGKLTFVPSHRRLPHVGSAVAFPSGEVLREIAGHNIEGAEIGHMALGEFLYADKSKAAQTEDWTQVQAPEVLVKFPMKSLVSRRSFIFARAGFGKSNLNKLLFSKLYEDTPTVEKRGGKKVPVGTIIFDPDGEYFWPDDKGRPGLCDVPHLKDKLVVFTSRNAPSAYYGSFVAGGIKLDIRSLKPSDVISIALAPEKQDQQNVAKLRGLSPDRWERLVDLIHRNRNAADLDEIRDILHLDRQQEMEAVAARSNMTTIVSMLHDPSSQLMGVLLRALEAGKICVVDVSQMRGAQAFILSGLILRRIFTKNQEQFTEADPKTIPTIAVIEEAQSVLNEKASASEPYISWVKEGRKYDLGALLVTQQPGSIPNEILSQGDNWFIFHLLSAGDLTSVKKANSHFSDDLLSSLLNEPIPGQGIFWSSVAGKAYPIPLRALSFENLYRAEDPTYKKSAIKTYATELKNLQKEIINAPIQNVPPAKREQELFPESDEEEGRGIDFRDTLLDTAIEVVKNNKVVIETNGIAWGALSAKISEKMPATVDDAKQEAYRLVPPALSAVFGAQDIGWHSYRNEKSITYIKKGAKG